MEFNHGNEMNIESKKKVGRRSVTKAKEVARKTKVEGLSGNTKG